jgi:hypothetical protein
MAKGRKGRTFRKKMRGGLEPGKPVDISTYNRPLPDKPTVEEVDNKILTKDDVMGGKLRRTRKRRMTKRRKNSRKSRKSKSRKMRGGVFMGDYLPSFLKSGQQKEQKIFDMRNQHNSPFENQPVEEEINRIEERNDKTVYDNIREFSPEFIEKMKENMKKFNELKQ